MIDVFERIRYVRSFVQRIGPKMTSKEMRICFGKLKKTKYRKSELTEKDLIIQDLLLQHDIKPATAYLWFCVLEYPAYIQQEIRERKISFTEAHRKNLESSKPKQNLGWEIRKEILEYVDKLAERDFLRGGEYAFK